MRDLSPAQQSAVSKLLEARRWMNAYRLRETRATLDSLVRKGYVERMPEPGALFEPRINVFYRIKPTLS